MEQKRAAMAEMKAQAYLQTYYDQRAEQRGNHARRAGGDMDVRQAESFHARDPAGGRRSYERRAGRSWPGWARPRSTRPAGGAATSTLDLHQVIPGSRVAGPARTVRCAQDDNLMVHAAMAAVQPGEIIVLTMPEPRAGRAGRRPAGHAGDRPGRGRDR